MSKQAVKVDENTHQVKVVNNYSSMMSDLGPNMYVHLSEVWPPYT